MDRQTLGPYVLLEEIGAGGMGTVYLGRHRETSELAAVKVLPATLAREEGFVMRFTREAEALRALTNPHVVRLLDSGVDDGTYFFAMEYVAGETLADRLKREQRLSWPQAFDFATQLCSALKAAHDAGIIHRDLKPSNVLLATDGQVKLTDFGVAQLFATERLTITGGVIGTAEYMSPEQAQGQRATKRSDLYSLGAILYAMLTGRPPFTGPTAMDVMHKQRYGVFDKPSRYVPELPPTVDVIIADLLAKSPDQRPPDAYVVSRRLQETVQKSHHIAHDDPTPADTAFAQSSTPAGPGVATFMRDLVRAEVIRSAEPTVLQRLSNNTFVLLGMLVALIAFVWWMATPRHTPEWQLAEATRILNEPAGAEWLRARDELLQPLLQSAEDRERWFAQAQPLLDEIAIYELEAKLTSKRRRGKKGASQTEAERLLLEARRLWEQGQLRQADQRLDALKALAVDDEPTRPIIQLADRWQIQLQEELSSAVIDRQAFVQAAVQRAQALASRDPSAAKRILRAVSSVYSDDDTVSEASTQATRLLTELEERDSLGRPRDGASEEH